MPTDADDSGFLSRWSRRKDSARRGVAREEVAPLPIRNVQTEAAVVATDDTTPQTPLSGADPHAAAQPAAEPPPTLADVALLHRDSDFTRFVGRSVQPEVKNAALAKLFRDPHFNVMDGLDVYIDDYGKPDPLPASMLRQMVQAQVLGLFDDDKTPTSNPPLADSAEPSAQPTLVAESPTLPPLASAAHENLDLQLQPDDEAGRAGPAAGAGEDAAGAH